jgi:hypothetical protein
MRALPEARAHEFMDLELRDEEHLKAERVKLFSECAVEPDQDGDTNLGRTAAGSRLR